MDRLGVVQCGGNSQLGEVLHERLASILVGESGYRIERLIARVADAEARIEGMLGQLPRAVGTDLSIAVRGSDASILPAIEDRPLPQEPFSLDGRVERLETGVRFYDFEIEFGELHARVDGTLGEPPGLEATDLNLRAEGPDLSVLDGYVDWPLPADGPLELVAHFEGSPEHFAMRKLHARLGKSDVDGFLELDLRGERPHLRGDFHSGRLELVELVDERDPPGEDDDFNVLDMKEITSMLTGITGVLTGLLGAVAAVSLLVGGIGIMNIMLVSVTERTREIGIRKAMGATKGNILLQFLVEAMTLCLLGGALGLAVGAAASYFAAEFAGWQTKISSASVVTAFTFSAVVGLVFGLWPAKRAAALDPIDALRYE